MARTRSNEKRPGLWTMVGTAMLRYAVSVIWLTIAWPIGYQRTTVSITQEHGVSGAGHWWRLPVTWAFRSTLGPGPV